MKQFLLLVGVVMLVSHNSLAQDEKSFEEIRKDDFKKLVGTSSNFEGFSVKYDKDKTSLLGSGGFTLNNKHIFMVGGSLGTSTNLTNLFNQEILPTYSIGVSYNFLLRGTKYFSKYFYDATFDDYQQAIKGRKAEIDSIKTKLAILSALDVSTNDIRIQTLQDRLEEIEHESITITTQDSRFAYRSKMKKRMLKGLEERKRVYTHKRLVWVSIASTYNNDQYGFIDYARPFNAQQYDTSFQTFSGQISFNGYAGWNHTDYKWNRFFKNPLNYRPVYIYSSLFGRISRSSNIADIKKKTVYDLEKSDYDTSSKILRQSGKSKSYYNGNYYQFSTMAIGARILISPFNHITLDFSAETNFIRNADKDNFKLNDYSVLSAGFFVYTGDKDTFKLNIGLALRRQQSSTTKNWDNRLELITSIPIGPIM